MAKITVNVGQNSHVYRDHQAITVAIPTQFINKSELLEVIGQAVANHLKTSVKIHEDGYQAFCLSPKES